MTKVIAVIPAFNEEKNIYKTVISVKDFVDEIIVVDDFSQDSTISEAEKTGAIVLKHIINRGQGASLATGTEYAIKRGADIIVHFDGDGQFLSEEIPEVISPIKSGEADVVFGSRFSLKKSDIPKFKTNVIMPLARLVNRIFIGSTDLTDPQSGFRALSREAAIKINIEQDRMAHCSEILFKVYKNKLRIKEVPIHVIYHDFGQRLSGGIKIIKELALGALIK